MITLINNWFVLSGLQGVCFCLVFFFSKQKTAYELGISDGSSDVCSSDLTPPGLRAGGEPVRGRLRAAALDNIEELRWPSDINNRRHPRPVAPRPGAHEQGLVETDRADRPEPLRILDQRCAVGDDRVHHRVPIAAQLLSDRRDGAAPADLCGHPPPGPVSEPRTWRCDLAVLLGPRPDLAGRLGAAPPALVPHQHRWASERRRDCRVIR